MTRQITAYLQSDVCKTVRTAYALLAPPVFERFPLVDVLRT